ncbi:MAG: hypothetical protein HW389_2062 [Bacteroidetes bacterium]|nr:hypothetical protein [Bacteroidota bacterium]
MRPNVWGNLIRSHLKNVHAKKQSRKGQKQSYIFGDFAAWRETVFSFKSVFEIGSRQVLLVVSISLAFSACGPIWRSPSYYISYGTINLPSPILTMEEYNLVIETHPRPYLVRIKNDRGSVLLFGAEHTKKSDDPQVVQIRSEWSAFKPTVALVEGRLGFLFRWFSDPVEQYGESGGVLDLAKKDGIPVFSWEPPMEKEVEWMLQKYPARRVALLYVLRPYVSNLRHGKPENPDSYVEEYREKRTQYNGLEGTLPSMQAIDSIWRADFSAFKDWRETSDEYGWPGYLGDLASSSNAFRDEHFARVIIDLVNKGHSVFAVSGSSHAVKLDAALQAALSPFPAKK